ncbi:MAG TPA: ABC transporter permease [Vicinamibacterales bacterium]|nr:ABC transporter permease [Vicinamibacterales bacterium]
MLRFLARRTLAALALAFVIASGGLVLARAAGGDFVAQSLGLGAKRETVERLRHARGLDRPFAEQYADWLRGVVRFDFGTSLLYQRPVRDLVAARAANSAVLGVAALVVACAIGIPLGLLSGSRPRTLAAQAVRLFSSLSMSVPPLIASLLLVWAAAVTGLLPIGGMTSMAAGHRDAYSWLIDVLWHLPVPVLALAIPFAATLERIQSQAIAGALREPAVIAARARGASAGRALWAHAFRLSVKAPIAVGGALAGALMSGSFAVELVTAWPGLGRLTYEALVARDVPLVAGCATAGALLVSLALVLADLLLAIADPRILEASEPAAAPMEPS